jgi:hypothetical protein
MAAFPIGISCRVTNGYKENFPETKKYLGGHKHVYLPKATVKAIFETHADMETFMRWYITDLDYGVNTFTISLPLFGVTRAWEVQLLNNLNTEPNTGAANIREIQMDLKIIDDIDTYIAI